MPYLKDELIELVSANLDDSMDPASAIFTYNIQKAVNYISNFFTYKKIYSGNTVNNQSYITKPSNCVEIQRVLINGEEYKRIKISEIKSFEESGSKAFYDWDEKVQIIPTPNAIAATKIFYLGGFSLPPLGTDIVDIPDRFIPLIVIIATWFAYIQIASRTFMNRENLTDAEVEDLKECSKLWHDNAVKMIEMMSRRKYE